MKRFSKFTCLFAATASLMLFPACTPGERGATTGALIGGGIGAAVAGSGNRAGGALIGGAIGAIAGSEINKNRYYGPRRYRY